MTRTVGKSKTRLLRKSAVLEKLRNEPDGVIPPKKESKRGRPKATTAPIRAVSSTSGDNRASVSPTADHPDPTPVSRTEEAIQGGVEPDHEGTLNGSEVVGTELSRPVSNSTNDPELTRKWIRNKADEIAVQEGGCWFDQARADHVCDFVEDNLVLYEGEKAGQPFRLMPWQRELLSRVFGWVRMSEQFKRPVRRFRKVSVWLPKKNGKSPLAAAVGLYLLCADGEQGQKVFSSAKDGKQAQIVHTHARRMAEQIGNKELKAAIHVHGTTGQITHKPTFSTYSILSGDNIQGQEGLNGSAIIDETHVVDERLASTLEYMGISRSEPLQFEVSSAGDNPLGYGYRQWEYGRNVENGVIRDDSFFYMFYGASQDASDDELMERETWYKANPSLGTTVYEEEFRESLMRAKRSLYDWAIFKKYRFNVWQTAEQPWLNIADWNACRREFGEEDFLGQQCIAGLDLARTRDLSALVLLFRMEDTVVEDKETKAKSIQPSYAILPYFFLPQETINRNIGRVPYGDWARKGHVIVTPGHTCDYGYIQAKFLELDRKFNIQQIIYDRHLANELTQDLSEGRMVEHEQVFAGTGVERVEFTQSGPNYTGPTMELERLVISGLLRHPGNDVLTWQAGHVTVKTDPYGHMRPIKQKENDYRTVDGIVATIMALAGAKLLDNCGSIYDTPGNVAIWHDGDDYDEDT